MAKIRSKYIHKAWWQTNIINLLGGAVIGVLIFLFISLLKGEWLPLRSFVSYIMFSIYISLGVINGIYLAQNLFYLHSERLSFIIVFYAFALLGMAAGVELSYLTLSLFRDIPYHFFHPQDMLFSSLVVIIICTLSFVHHWQRATLQNQIRLKELDMMRLRQLKTQAELASLHARINPHFLYNSLNSIASLIHHAPDTAESMTIKLSKLFRYSINHNGDDLVSLSEELETVFAYMDIEKLRFGERIYFSIDADEQLRHARIPRFLIQPLIENALKHGLKNVTGGGLLGLTVTKSGDIMNICVADNGVPFPEELQTGHGLQSTYDKLGLLYGQEAEVEIKNYPEKKITIRIPLRYE